MKRIQRKRSRGWRMPPNTVYVGRPTRWGNPYSLERSQFESDFMARQQVVSRYEAWIRQVLKEDPSFLDPLLGKDLACWCPLNKLCHADVLLKILEAKH